MARFGEMEVSAKYKVAWDQILNGRYNKNMAMSWMNLKF